MTAERSWTDARRVLCVRLDGMGDLLMTTPAIAALRASGHHITVLASAAGAAIARLVPEIDDVIVYEAPWTKATPPRAPAPLTATSSTHDTTEPRAPDGVAPAPSYDGPTTARSADDLAAPSPDEAILRRLAAERFDAAAIFTVFTQSPLPAALLCFLAGIPRRLAHCRENPYQLLTDWLPEREPAEIDRHEVKRQLDLVASIGAFTDDERLRLRVPQPARDRVARLLAQHDCPPDRWILVHPGATAASRRYPPEMLADAANLLAERTGRTLVLTGSAADVPLVDDVRRRLRAPSLTFAGALDLAELAALIEAAPLLICNNSGPAHIAAAVGTRVVDLYALTNPQHTPWRVPSRVLFHDVPCRNCYKSACPQLHHACLRGVPPARVAAAAIDLLASAPAR